MSEQSDITKRLADGMVKLGEQNLKTIEALQAMNERIEALENPKPTPAEKPTTCRYGDCTNEIGDAHAGLCNDCGDEMTNDTK